MGIIEKEPVWFHGKSSRVYGFRTYDLETEFNNCQAVYIFTKLVITTENAKGYNRLYVGETDNLATVIQNHENSTRLKQCGVNSICVHLDKDGLSRRKKVHDIISGVGGPPPCNVLGLDE